METHLEALARVEIRIALEDLNTDFCHFLDYGMVDELVDLFTVDARYSHGNRVSSGREAIRALFRGRATAGTRTSRHLQTGLKITLLAQDKAAGQSVCLTFAADAAPPVTPATPFLVADFSDEYQRDQDGRWRISRRHIARIFTAADNQGPVGQPEK